MPVAPSIVAVLSISEAPSLPEASIALVAIGAAVVDGTPFRAQMMLLGGFVILLWVLMRRTMRRKKRGQIEEKEWEREQRQMDAASHPTLPLANAPVDVLRWQGAMFDLQRELKAELETKISVIQAMVQLADQRIATLQTLAESIPENLPECRENESKEF